MPSSIARITHRVFLDACAAEKNIELSVLRKALRYEDKGDRVVLHMEGGEAIEGCALVGADGLWSRVREQLLGDGKPRVSGHIAYRAVLPRAEVPEGLWQNNVVLWAGPKNPRGFNYPLRCGESFFTTRRRFLPQRQSSEEGWNAFGDPGGTARAFSGERPEVLALLAKIDARKMGACDCEPVREWSGWNSFCVGSSAG